MKSIRNQNIIIFLPVAYIYDSQICISLLVKVNTVQSKQKDI